MPNTITAYNTFISGTKARSSEVNTNFSNYRGTILPISPSSAIAENRTHDLGSSEYYFLNSYSETVNFGLTITAAVSFSGNTAGVTALKDVNSSDKFKRPVGVTHTASFDQSLTTSFTWESLGPALTVTATDVIYIGLDSDDPSNLVVATITGRTVPVIRFTTDNTGAASAEMNIALLRDGTTISVWSYGTRQVGTLAAFNFSVPPQTVNFYDDGATTGTLTTYQFQWMKNSTTSSVIALSLRSKIIAGL